jgi:hypothetical protein
MDWHILKRLFGGSATQRRVSSGMKGIQATPLPFGDLCTVSGSDQERKDREDSRGHRKARISSALPSNKGGWPRAGVQAYKHRYFLCLPDPDSSASRFMLKSDVRKINFTTEEAKN